MESSKKRFIGFRVLVNIHNLPKYVFISKFNTSSNNQTNKNLGRRQNYEVIR